MGLELPEWLTEPLSWVGLTWPEADEELLFAAGQQWLAFAGTLRGVAQGAEGAADAVGTYNLGETADAFRRWWEREDGPRRRFVEDITAAEIIGCALIIFAAVTLALKIAFMVQLIMLAISVAEALAAAVATFGASTALVPGLIAAARVACRQLIKQAVRKVEGELKRLFAQAKKLLKRVEGKLARKGAKKGAKAAQDVMARTRHYGNSSPADFGKEFPELSHGVNPNFGKDPAFGINCQSCVTATDRSLAGQASSAVPRRFYQDANGNLINDPRFDWPHGVNQALGGNNPLRSASGYDDIASELENAGDGARGIVHGMRVDANGNPVAGHVFNVVNRNGTVHFIDGQTGGYAYLENYSGFQFMRTN
ncbi:papain fold toxin 1 (glutamine deamidase) of polymorphic toxin system [Micromonospora kangleipakensis]|uniref:Papain fold toxin 1 (Glutamine deamidase) of polymorphic toxin system n=1 Tax=Micromonospora kangleipakensis TaxID=1077942 RepID=A0A4Q8B3T7_9ACTN|nr:toxin glutamine deamidase domain-containing protein [Micromonospora kangleipakensis]RZU72194.1 papain fold toxin 1 (glutamine deamidase) of polymorphic toxin system [Micromonospora kangleipakensis]